MAEPIGESGFLEYNDLKIYDITSVTDFPAYSGVDYALFSLFL